MHRAGCTMTGTEEKREGSGTRGHKLLALCIRAGLPQSARHVCLLLHGCYENEYRIVSPSIDRIADDCAVKRKTARKAISQLVQASILEVLAPRNGGEATRYRLVDTSEMPKRIFGALP